MNSIKNKEEDSLYSLQILEDCHQTKEKEKVNQFEILQNRQG